MIISHTNKFVFIHNPKVAGTSIRRSLFKYDENKHRLAYQEHIPQLERVVELFHVCAGDMNAVWPELADKWDEYFKFGFVRDPYQRLFSSWAEHKRQHHLEADTDFNEWARMNLTPTSVRFDWRFTHFCPQHYYFFHSHTKFADFIGRYEDLHASWGSVCRHLGLEQEEQLGHSKDQDKYDTGPRLSLGDLDSDVLGLVNRLYANDFFLFGYQMQGELPSGRTHAERVEELAQPIPGYDKAQDPRHLTLGEQCMYWRKRAEEAERRVNSGFQVGDIVVSKDPQRHPLRSGAEWYTEAVVVSVEPFVLVSLRADMRWQSTVNPERFTVIGSLGSDSDQLEKCMRRLEG